MPSYIILGRWTQKGVENLKQSPGRLDAAKKAMESAGARMTAFNLVMGQYDFVTTVEAPNDEAMAKVALALGSQGNVRTETLRSFSEADYRKIISGLP
jgi:uncharacterized protein with GYD domain